ncbi:MAG: serine hydrolase domain-containing protein, partial [Chitinophagaceae bacterium]
LTKYLEKGIRDWKIPGVAVGIIKNDSIHYINGLGITDITTKQPINTNTLFPIWSMGKSFTALALAMLEQQGKINLSLPIRQYLPNFKMSNIYAQNNATTIDLLSHRLGVETFQGDFLWSESTLKTNELITKWSQLPNKYGLRNGFQYSNFGYLIAGNIISKISHLSWQQFIQKHILDSLQMHNSFLQFQQVLQQPSVAKGHSYNNSNWQVLPMYTAEPIQPFGGMYSNITDMLKWLQLHINEGKLAKKTIFDQSIIYKVLHPQNIVGNQYLPNGLHPLVTYALGWDRREYFNKTVYSHGGAYGGFISMMAFVPEEKLGLVILTNADNHELGEAVKWQVIDAYLQINKHNYLQNLLNYTAVAEKEEKATTTKLFDSINQQLPLSIPLNQFCGS